MTKLSDSLTIRGTVTRNRIAIPPMVCFYAPNDDGGVLERSVEHYRNLAKGGAGLIIQEATCVSCDGKLAPMQIGIWDDSQIPNLRRITDAVHAEGCPIFVQLHHAGFKSVNGAPLSASAYVWEDRRRGTSITAQEMTLEDIRRIQNDFVQAARRAAEAGYDGMEFHGCHEYLISQILCSSVNKRTDIYGAEPWRFVSEILVEMRKVVPETFALGVRIAGCEPTLEWGMKNIVSLEPYADFFDVSAGFIEKDSFKEMPEDYPFNPFIWMAHEARKRLSPETPVFAVNSIDYPDQAQAILDYTGVDMVDVGRSALVDCQWPNKALRGEEPGHCLHCARCGWMTGNCAGHKKFGTTG